MKIDKYLKESLAILRPTFEAKKVIAAAFHGSIAAGLGNEGSDLDIFAVLDDEDTIYYSEFCGLFDRRTDIVYVSSGYIKKLITGIEQTKGKRTTTWYFEVSAFLNAKPFFGECFYESIIKSADKKLIKDQMIFAYTANGMNTCEDIFGELNSGDILQTVEFTKIYLRNYADILLILSGDEYPKDKWRTKRCIQAIKKNNQYSPLISRYINLEYSNYDVTKVDHLCRFIDAAFTLTDEVFSLMYKGDLPFILKIPEELKSMIKKTPCAMAAYKDGKFLAQTNGNTIVVDSMTAAILVSTKTTALDQIKPSHDGGPLVLENFDAELQGAIASLAGAGIVRRIHLESA